MNKQLTNAYIYISLVLKNLGIPEVYDGYKYLRDAVTISVKDGYALNSVTDKIYTHIANSRGTSVSCVERSIRRAINIAWNCDDAKLKEEIFGKDCDKPKNSEFIAAVTEYIKTALR